MIGLADQISPLLQKRKKKIEIRSHMSPPLSTLILFRGFNNGMNRRHVRVVDMLCEMATPLV